jgi:hypothetical protein
VRVFSGEVLLRYGRANQTWRVYSITRLTEHTGRLKA